MKSNGTFQIGRRVFTFFLLLVVVCLSCSDSQDSNGTVSREEQIFMEHQEDIKFKYKSFTFIRIRYSGNETGPGSWMTDYPESDLNFSARFQEITGLEAEQNPKVMELTHPDLKKYPFIYIVEGGGLLLSEEEIRSLRSYLLDGGFLMIDDFWGEEEWKSLYSQIKRVFPERELIELKLDHEIFNCFYKIQEKPQVPSINVGVLSQSNGVTWEREDGREPHYYGLNDDQGRLMAILCHNTDLGDGWERVTENEYYYREFSLKKALPMGINIVVYALTN